MTLPEACKMAKPVLKKSMNIGEAVKETLLQALGENRITYGVYACAKELEISPETVMLCILPNADQVQDVSIHIQHTLMEAYCLEHDIKMIKVDDSNKLATILAFQQDSANNNEQATDERLLADFNSVLIRIPHQKSSADQFVVDFCNMVVENDVFPRPKIELPELTILFMQNVAKKISRSNNTCLKYLHFWSRTWLEELLSGLSRTKSSRHEACHTTTLCRLRP